MARLNAAYGSELHLLRMLGRHRKFLDHLVLEVTKADAIEWLDFPSGEVRLDKQENAMWDREWHHLGFLPDGDPAKQGWRTVWPAHRPGPNWDVVGKVTYGNSREWLLAEAKANTQELASTCSASDPKSRELIERTLSSTKKALGVPEGCDWLAGYYQFCNRLAVLHWMNCFGTPARLLYIYFTGDIGDARRTCPATPDQWNDTLQAQAMHVGLPPGHPLHERNP